MFYAKIPGEGDRVNNLSRASSSQDASRHSSRSQTMAQLLRIGGGMF